MASPSSSSSAWASVSGRRGAPGWVLLHREPRLADTDPAGMDDSDDADVVVKLVPPPAVSTASVSRALALHPDAAAWDDTERCRIEGADASGRILFGFTSPRAPGEFHLVVCRPVASSWDTAKGKARPLPACPEEALGLALSPAAPTGILSDHGAKSGDGFFVAQMQRAESSTPASVALALWFSSDDNQWTVSEVPGEDRWRDFAAKRIVSHDGGVHGDAARLVFVDLRRRGLLLFHPRRLTATRFIDLPEGGGGEAIDEGQASVDSSEGRLVYVLFDEVAEGLLVRFWCLSEDERGWTSHFHRTSDDDVFGCDARVWPLRGAPRLGPVDPDKMTRIVFGVRCPGDGTLPSFCLEVRPAEMGLRRVSSTCLDSVAWPVPGTPNKTWRDTVHTAVQDGKHVAMLALGAAQKGRKYADSLPGAVQLVGGALSLPYTSVALTTAKAIKTVNDYFTISENISSWVWKNRPGAPGVLCKVVGNIEEAGQAHSEWLLMNKPTNMVVDPAVGLAPAEWDAIREFLIEKGGGTLVQHYDWEMVGRPPR